ncbi:MAG: Heparinase family protein, partial [Noviherbaspirillum sp.]|nr:Heparinase family protein [Noviherbaspirillum sp.]
MPALNWMVSRLRTMSAAEIAWRAGRAVQARMERSGRGTASCPPPTEPKWGRGWLGIAPSGFDAARYLDAAERILAGQFDLFALRGAALGFPPRWNRDPKTGIEAPPVFGKDLDYRDETLVGDIKYLWELNRHHALVTLAQAFHLSGRERYAEGCRRLLESWFEQCRYPLGPNWTCALEHGIRLVNWSVAWHLLGGPDGFPFDGEGKEFRRRWLISIYQHCHFIAGYLSRFSSANNHLFGEYMGLFIGAVTWPCWRRSARWRKLAKRGLEEEALRQNGADGVNLEQAIWYHHEVADMMLLCALCGRQNDIAFSGAYWKRLEAMLDFILAMMDGAGNVPMIGDSDDAVMVRFSPEPDSHVYRSLLATGAVIFRRRDFKRRAGLFDDKSRWLTGDIGADVFDALPADRGRPATRAFTHGGYFILGADFDDAAEVKIVADAGPLGYLSIAAHGHADALAFTLCAGGKELLIDPGTYAYHTDGKWRAHFRGTAAHNTVRIDGLDQSVMCGNFMWRHKARARLASWRYGEDRDCLIAS